MTESPGTPRRRTSRAMALSSGEPLAQYDPGRRCTFPGCRVQLSRYNPRATCAAHGGWEEDRTPRRRRKAS